MKNLGCLLIVVLVAGSLKAQELTADNKSKIKEGLSIEILEINRVEKYGWDNLEVLYKVTNESGFDIQKLDFTIYLLDESKEEVGSVEVHAFRIPKDSEKSMKYADVGSAFVNTQFKAFTTEYKLLDIVIEGEQDTVVSIKGAELAQR